MKTPTTQTTKPLPGTTTTPLVKPNQAKPTVVDPEIVKTAQPQGAPKTNQQSQTTEVKNTTRKY